MAGRNLPGQPLFIQTVAGLVEHAEERRGEIRLHVARRQPHVPRPESGAKRMRRGVDATGVEIEADRRSYPRVEILLRGNRIRSGREGRRMRCGNFHRPCRDVASAGAHRVEQRSDRRGAGAALKAFKQGIVGLASVAPEVRFFAGDPEQFFERRLEEREIRLRPGGLPRMFRQRAGQRIPRHQLDRQFRRAIEFTPQLPQIGIAAFRFRRFQIFPPRIGDGQFVGARGQPGKLAGAVFGGGGRQVGFLVPPENRGGRIDESEFTDFLEDGHARISARSAIPRKAGNAGPALARGFSNPPRISRHPTRTIDGSQMPCIIPPPGGRAATAFSISLS